MILLPSHERCGGGQWRARDSEERQRRLQLLLLVLLVLTALARLSSAVMLQLGGRRRGQGVRGVAGPLHHRRRVDDKATVAAGPLSPSRQLWVLLLSGLRRGCAFRGRFLG
jgi:hypothetical protein